MGIVIQPRRIRGGYLNVLTLPDGRVYVDVQPEWPQAGNSQTRPISRGGPEYSPHFCRFEDYGLADDLVRCRKCGIVTHKSVAGAKPA